MKINESVVCKGYITCNTPNMFIQHIKEKINKTQHEKEKANPQKNSKQSP